MRRPYYPRSFVKLLLGGFVLVALPLAVALVNSAVSVDRLAERSRHAIDSAQQLTRASQRLIELVTALERNARQFAVLDDRSWLDAYALNPEELGRVAAELGALPLDARGRAALDAVVAGEQAIHATLSRDSAKPAEIRAAVGGFAALAERAQSLAEHARAAIGRDVDALRETAAAAQRIAFWQMAAIVPLLLLLVGGATLLIARPIGELDAAIRRLGSGELAEPVSVSGPRDLEYLGERLEWMRHALVGLEEQKNRFLRQVSHELKTPLAAVREGAELLTDGALGGLAPRQQEVAQIVRGNSVELQRLIEDLLDYGALQFRASELNLRPTRLTEVLDRVAAAQQLALAGKELKLEFDCPEMDVRVDGEKLRVILDNLVSNAIRFSPAGESIRVSARRSGGRLVIEVADRGPGIAPEDRERIFEAFYQGRREADGRVRGSGLGLAIVSEYAQAHGGRAELADNEATGARFRVTLPVEG